MRSQLLITAIACAAAPSALAQAPAKPHSNPAPHFYGTLGYAFEEPDGFELALGVQADWNDRIYVRAAPLNVVLYDAEGFYRDTFSNGQSRCRNESNGRFATDESCTSADWRFDADLYVRITRNILIGGGGIYTYASDDFPEREGESSAFGALMLEWSERFGVELRGGDTYGAIRLRAAF